MIDTILKTILFSKKTKKSKKTANKSDISLFQAIEGFEKASREIDEILDRNPELSKKFQSFFK